MRFRHSLGISLYQYSTVKRINVSVNSKRDHSPPPPPPGATPGHLTPVQLHIVGHLTRIEARPIEHLTRRKNAGHRSRVKRILYSMSYLHDTSPAYYNIRKYVIIESLEFSEGREESCFSVNIRRICIKSCETFRYLIF